MPEHGKCPLCNSILELVHLPGLATFYGRNLPDWNVKACYAADLSAILSVYISSSVFEDFAKGFTPVKNSKAKWHVERKALAFATSLAVVSSSAEFRGLVEGPNSQYLKRELDRVCPGASELIHFFDGSSGSDYGALCAKTARLFEESIRRAGLKPKGGVSELMFMVHPMIVGALAGASSYLGVKPHREDSPIQGSLVDFLSPSSDHETRSFEPASQKSEERAQITSRNDNRFLIGDARRDYPIWVQRCEKAAEDRRIPISMIRDLIPKFDDADHSLRDPVAWGDLLNETFHGRSSWLEEEGVRDSDIAEYWGAPPWVQDFREALIKREFELQIESTQKSGMSRFDAINAALFFLPTFSVASPLSKSYSRSAQLPLQYNEELEASGFLPEPLPIELFSRVSSFFSACTSREIEQLLMSNNFHRANDLVRMLVMDGKI
jgi:hypothetical protein